MSNNVIVPRPNELRDFGRALAYQMWEAVGGDEEPARDVLMDLAYSTLQCGMVQFHSRDYEYALAHVRAMSQADQLEFVRRYVRL